MPQIESLLYRTNDMETFIKFCVEGKRLPTKPGDPPKFEQDEQQRDMTGVFKWLTGWSVDEAHFFHTSQNDPLQLFIVQVLPEDVVERPWFRHLPVVKPRILFQPEIPGIDRQIRLDGLFGKRDTFLSLTELFAGLEKDDDLDEQFAALQTRVRDQLEGLNDDPVAMDEFFAALRGDRGTDAGKVFARHNFPL